MSLEVKVPEIGESISEVTIGQWLKQNGDSVEMDDVLCEVESEKATVEIVAEEDGVLQIFVKEGDTVEVGTVIAKIEEDGKSEKQPEAKAEAGPEEKEQTDTSPKETPKEQEDESRETDADAGHAKISPVAANILREAGLQDQDIEGSGVGGKVTKADALRLVDEAKQGKEAPKEKKEEAPKPSAGKPTFSRTQGDRTERRERMSTLRKTIARRMLESKQGTAMLTTMNELDMSVIKDLRTKYKESFKEKYDVNLGFMSFFTKAVTHALQEFPMVNARIDGDDLVFHDFCDIGIAVSTPRGLVVPVLRNTETMNLAQIEAEVNRLAERARDNKLTIDEMTGGTFSITNGGVFGSLISTPIINAPQSAILGMHTIQDRPVVRDGQIVIRPMMYISLSYDHRIIDGKESVTFLIRVKEILEDPIRLLLDV